jgi:hypothetical protein
LQWQLVLTYTDYKLISHNWAIGNHPALTMWDHCDPGSKCILLTILLHSIHWIMCDEHFYFIYRWCTLFIVAFLISLEYIWFFRFCCYPRFGSEADSLQTCKSSLIPTAPMKDGAKAKMFQGMVLRYCATLENPKVVRTWSWSWSLRWRYIWNWNWNWCIPYKNTTFLRLLLNHKFSPYHGLIIIIGKTFLHFRRLLFINDLF